ncbi:UNVERIFIED_CONTAM: putative nuclear transport factor 2, partial [Eudyptes robustus]|uniref:NTF2-related export protein n=1 Tax=Bursaphelenchus xylophilus TaxID=6326 RepID=A0A1I7S7F3_BURXY
MNYNPNFEQIGNALIQLYYSKFDVPDGATRAAGLQELYDPEASIMTFEGSQVRGRQAILEKFGTLPFQQIQRAITKVDCQPLADGSVAIAVFGQLKTDEDPVNSFTQFFVLKPNGGSFFIANEIFRLVLHDM